MTARRTSRSQGPLTRAFPLLVPLLLAFSLLPWVAAPASAHEGHPAGTPFTALVFSKTAGFRHGSIPAGVAAVQKLGVDNGFTVDTTEDPAAFTEANLAKYDVVIWLSTTGDVLNDTQQAAFERYIQAGGGYAGVHSASDTEYTWAWYGNLVGAYFKGHPAPATATIKVEDPAHPSTAGMAPTWSRYDEWYNYQTNPRGKVHVLASLVESSYSGGDMGVEHPISWCQEYDGGRSWYTGMGHTDASFSEPAFLHHLLGGIRTAAGAEKADCRATLDGSFEKVTLDGNTANPMELDIAGDGRVFYADRNGDVKIVATNGNVSIAGHLAVDTSQEFGLLGIALDPAFATNNYLYLYYSPAGSAPVDRVSRFTMNGNTLDLASEKVVLTIDTQRAECCHAGGALEFDHNGDLYIATGDNTNPFASGGYSPIDEQAGRSAWDAQRSSANSNTLNGKVLRITPQANGTYTIPAGNLFAPGTAKTRPEIYAMGFRNPFRIGLNEQTNKLIVADYGPDAGSANASRGPDGRVEWNVLNQPGFYGWPYCVSNNVAYNDYNFATGASGAQFSCTAPRNDSPNNTGITDLPAAIPATMWQGKASTGVPEIGGSGAPMTSGTYDYDPNLTSDRKWPEYFDGKAIWADWNNSRLFTVQMDAAGTGYSDVNRFLSTMGFVRPHAMQFGPDGALYIIEWGGGFGGNNADSGLYRIDYVMGSRAPIARAVPDKTSGPAPLTVAFNGSTSTDPDGTPITYAWDFDGNGTTDSTAISASHTYTTAGSFTARLTVTDADGRSAVDNIDIVVGNTRPTVTLTLPQDGGFFEFGDTVRYTVTVTDPEDGPIDCNNVIVQPALGHDQHAHGYGQYRGCSGVVPIAGDEGHVGANIFGTLTATYTDKGNGAAPALTSQDTVVLHTKRTEAEYFESTGRLVGVNSPGTPGVELQASSDTAGGSQSAAFIEPGDWFGFDMMNLTRIDQISLRAASPGAAGAQWAVRTGNPNTGPTVATITVPNTGGWQTYGNFGAVPSGTSTTVSEPLFFVQTSGGSNINWIDFAGQGVTENRRPVLTAAAAPATGTAPLVVNFTASATDPDGDALSYAWNFGDGITATTANPSHTFQVSGDYVATVTVTDARGAKATKQFPIDAVQDPATQCFTGRSDDFVGTTLNKTRWDAIVREDANLTVSNGQLHIPLTATDIYGTANGNTPNLVLQHLPGGAFEVTTKVNLAARRSYQQAGLIIYGDDDNYLKLVQMGTASSPDAASRIFQFGKELVGSPSTTNTAALGASFPDTFWVRMSSPDGLTVTASYSTDGVNFTAIPGTRTLEGINEPRVGVFGLANQAASLPITANFENFLITPDDKAAVQRSDEFAGSALDERRWSNIVRKNASMTVSDGQLHLPLAPTDIWGTSNRGTPNIVLQPLPTGAFTVTSKITLPARRSYEQAGLIIYGDDDNYLKLINMSAGTAANRVFQFAKEQAASPSSTNSAALGSAFPDTFWVRMTSTDGVNVTASYSSDGTNFTAVGGARSLAGISQPRIGVFAQSYYTLANPITAHVENFVITPDRPTSCPPNS